MRIPRSLPSLSLFVAFAYSAMPLQAKDAMKPEDLVAHHLDSLGSKEARAAAKTRVVQGAAVYRILVGGGGITEGKTGLVSDGSKSRFMMKFPTEYRGETFITNSNQSRSPWLLSWLPMT